MSVILEIVDSLLPVCHEYVAIVSVQALINLLPN